MAKLPYFPFYAADWLLDERLIGLSHTAKGVYVDLLALAWGSSDCSLPDDDYQLAIAVRWPDPRGLAWSEVRLELEPFWRRHKGRLVNKRLVVEWRKAQEKHENLAQAGARGGRAKAASQARARLEPGQSGAASQALASDQIRSDQNRTEQKTHSRTRSSGSAASRRAPAGLALDGEFLAAAEKILGADRAVRDWQWDQFRDHEFRVAHTDWLATWRKWCRTASERSGQAPGVQRKRMLSRAEQQIVDAQRELREAEEKQVERERSRSQESAGALDQRLPRIPVVGANPEPVRPTLVRPALRGSP